MAIITATKAVTLKNNLNGTFTLRVTFEEATTNENFSQIKIVGVLSRGTGGFEVTNGGTLRLYWHDNKNNQDILVGSVVISQLSSNYPTAKSLTKTIEVEHKDDGTLSGYAKATWTKDRSYDYVPNSGSVSTTNTALTTIEQGTIRICKNGTYYKAKAYIGKNGQWRLCTAYIGKNGNWLKGN